jgi:heme exporter protein C
MVVPMEEKMGVVQRIFYFHVPAAFSAFLGVAVCVLFSALYLWKRERRHDLIAHAGAELGVLFCTIVLLTGPIWARPVWGVWWTGEAKLVTALILFFVYVAYLMFRAYFPPGAQRQRLAAIIAIIGAIDSPIIYYAANLWSQAHPPAVIGPNSDAESAFSGEFGTTLLVATLAFTLLFIYIAKERLATRESEDELIAIRRNFDEAELAN